MYSHMRRKNVQNQSFIFSSHIGNHLFLWIDIFLPKKKSSCHQFKLLIRNNIGKLIGSFQQHQEKHQIDSEHRMEKYNKIEWWTMRITIKYIDGSKQVDYFQGEFLAKRIIRDSERKEWRKKNPGNPEQGRATREFNFIKWFVSFVCLSIFRCHKRWEMMIPQPSISYFFVYSKSQKEKK